MRKSIAEYEKLIRGSAVFSLNKSTHPTAYKREALKLVDHLYRYLTTINATKYAEFGLEIAETANHCLKNYTPEQGDFLHYFNAAISKVQRRSYVRQKMSEKQGGIHIPENDQRIIRKYLKYVEANNTCTLTDKTISALSSLTGFSHSKILDCIHNYNNSFIVSSICQSSDGIETNIFDLIPSALDTETKITMQSRAEAFILRIEEVYNSRQSRQKPLLSKLLTAKLSEHLIGNDRLQHFAKQRTFFDEDIFTETCSRQSPITAREIAASCSLSEQSVSRTYKTFISLL